MLLALGHYGENTVRRLKWIENVLAPANEKSGGNTNQSI
jgi:hypothetical protein